MARNELFLVVGLGRFGGALAEQLSELGRDVLGIDTDARLVQDHANLLSHVAQADGTDIDALRELGVDEVDAAVVAIGTSVEASVLTTLALVELAVPRIVAKAFSAKHSRILELVGAHRVVFPEADQGREEALRLAGHNVLDSMQIDGGFLVVETTAPPHLVGQSLADADLLKREGVTVVAIKSTDSTLSYAEPSSIIEADDILVIVGERDRVERFVHLR